MIELYLFDLDGTLIESFLEEVVCPKCSGTTHGEDPNEPCEQCHRTPGRWLKLREDGYDDVVWLPNRAARLRRITDSVGDIAVVTNQTGIHFGYQSREQVEIKLRTVRHGLRALAPNVHTWYADRPGPRRKPNPGMLHEAMWHYGYEPHETLMVGDMKSDREAAENAGCAFSWSQAFFGDAPPEDYVDLRT